MYQKVVPFCNISFIFPVHEMRSNLVKSILTGDKGRCLPNVFSGEFFDPNLPTKRDEVA